MRLIDADAFIEEARNRIDMQDEYLPIHIKYFVIDEMPTIDARPVKHGKWIYEPKDAIEMMFTLPKCSECGFYSADGMYYCSCCGARMDKKE